MRRELSGSSFTETRNSLAAQQIGCDDTPPSCAASLCFARSKKRARNLKLRTRFLFSGDYKLG